MDERTAELLLYVDATLTEMSQLAARGRDAYDSDIAIARACHYNIVRLKNKVAAARHFLDDAPSPGPDRSVIVLVPPWSAAATPQTA